MDVIRKRFPLLALIAIMTAMIAVIALTPAQGLAQKQHSNMLLKEHGIVIRDSIAAFDYDAGDANISGILHGPAVSYTYHDAFYPIMARAEGEILFGFTDYDEKSISANSRDIIVNVRGLLGYDILYHDNLVLTPYTGLGLRYWNNDARDSKAPDQSFTYIYLPFGVETLSSLAPSVDFGTRLELDLLLDGTVNTEFGGSSPRRGKARNDLGFGYGLRLSAYITKQFEAVGVGFEPFIRYWNVNSSDRDWVRNTEYEDLGNPVSGFENYRVPHSHTFIWGASLSIHF